MTESLNALATKSLMSETCECGSPKVKGQSFCRKCYFELPMKLRSELYKSISDGYAQVWDEAKTYLRAETDRLSNGRLF